MEKRTEMVLPVPIKAFLQLSPDMAMLFTLFRCTHPPPPVPSFLLMWPKDIVISDTMNLNSDISAIGPKSDHMVRWPSPSVFAYGKQAKSGAVVQGLGTKLGRTIQMQYSM